MKSRVVKVFFDTNVWISFLIGKRLSGIRPYISDGRIQIVTTDLLLWEIKEVTGRKKLRKYFAPQSVNELMELLELIAEKVHIPNPVHTNCRDPKDNFLLDLIDFSQADFLVTGDADLLALNPFMTARILLPSEFEELLESL